MDTSAAKNITEIIPFRAQAGQLQAFQ